MKKLDPKSRWLFFVRYLCRWFIIDIFIIFSFIGVFFDDDYSGGGFLILKWIVITFAVLAFISYIWSYFAFKFYKYELTDTVFKKELGVVYKQYISIPYARIQNVDIFRGIWARILGLSDLHIQTAGMGGGNNNRWAALSEGRLPGLTKEDAEKMREELMKQVSKIKNQGL